MNTSEWIRLIAEVVGFLILGGGVVVAVRVSIAVLATKVDLQNKTIGDMADELKKVADILVRMGQYDEKFRGVDRRFTNAEGRMERIEKHIDELARGEGYVLPIRRGAHEMP